MDPPKPLILTSIVPTLGAAARVVSNGDKQGARVEEGREGVPPEDRWRRR